MARQGRRVTKAEKDDPIRRRTVWRNDVEGGQRLAAELADLRRLRQDALGIDDSDTSRFLRARDLQEDRRAPAGRWDLLKVNSNVIGIKDSGDFWWASVWLLPDGYSGGHSRRRPCSKPWRAPFSLLRRLARCPHMFTCG
ncbi:hypothetical protein AOX55_00001045 [Sinorhizobium fredii CCBAU 25509]|nr:hypothetical protein AOX55_00001045 [Sinorhizobium fredii CCBAU 25509]